MTMKIFLQNKVIVTGYISKLTLFKMLKITIEALCITSLYFLTKIKKIINAHFDINMPHLQISFITKNG